jgi:hypothetical protein
MIAVNRKARSALRGAFQGQTVARVDGG